MNEQLSVSVYHAFVCVGGDCAYTCCRDWTSISIDNASMERYKQNPHITNGIDITNRRFRYKKDNTCTFLSDQALCSLVLRYGEHILCDTCRSFPRMPVNRNGIIERSLSNGCPEVLRILDQEAEALYFIYPYDSFPEEYVNDTAIGVRNCLIDLLQLTGVPLYTKCQMLYMFSERFRETGAQTISLFSDANYLSVLAERIDMMPDEAMRMMGKLHAIFNAFAEKCTSFQPYEKYLKPYYRMELDLSPEQYENAKSRLKLFMKRYEMLLEQIAVQFAFRQFAEHDADMLTGQVVSLMIELSISVYTVFLNLLFQNGLTEEDIYVILSFYARVVEQNKENMLQLIRDLQSEPAMQNGSLQFLTHILKYK